MVQNFLFLFFLFPILSLGEPLPCLPFRDPVISISTFLGAKPSSIFFTQDDGGGRQQRHTMIPVHMQGKVSQWFVILLWELISCWSVLNFLFYVGSLLFVIFLKVIDSHGEAMDRKVMEREGTMEEIRWLEKRVIRDKLGKKNKKGEKEKIKKILIIDFKISTSNDLNLLRYHVKNLLLSHGRIRQ